MPELKDAHDLTSVSHTVMIVKFGMWEEEKCPHCQNTTTRWLSDTQCSRTFWRGPCTNRLTAHNRFLPPTSKATDSNYEPTTTTTTRTCVFILSRDSHSRLYSQVHVYSFYHEIHIHSCIHRYTCIHSITRFTFTSVFRGTCVFILSRDSHSRLYS